jgi:hypothetical protein
MDTDGTMDWDELHAASSRLEEHLAGLSYDRALPDLATILRDASAPERLLFEDERARKVLHEAILARPLSSHEAVEQRRVEVELLTLEVSVLTTTLRRATGSDRGEDHEAVTRATTRLGWIRSRLGQLRAEL